MICCNQNCKQGRTCTAYKDSFDHLGNRRSDLRLSDLIICGIAIAVIAALFSGVLA